MSDVELVRRAVDRSASNLTELAAAVSTLSDLGEVKEARARIEAVRAWAKVHQKLRDLRLDLLRAEVSALVRIVELGGINDLPARDRRAAEHLAGLSASERARMLASAGANCTTAAGMVRAVWDQDELAQLKRTRFQAGRDLASAPPVRPLSDEAIKTASRHVTDVAAALKTVVDNYTSRGVPFTTQQMAEEIVETAALGDQISGDDSLMNGVLEVCRAAIRSAPALHIRGTVLPRLITCQTEDGAFIRVPVENATLSQLDDMRRLRCEQIEQDRAALRKLDEVAQRLRGITGAHDGSRIGSLIATSLEASEEHDQRRSA